MKLSPQGEARRLLDSRAAYFSLAEQVRKLRARGRISRRSARAFAHGYMTAEAAERVHFLLLAQKRTRTPRGEHRARMVRLRFGSQLFAVKAAAARRMARADLLALTFKDDSTAQATAQHAARLARRTITAALEQERTAQADALRSEGKQQEQQASARAQERTAADLASRRTIGDAVKARQAWQERNSRRADLAFLLAIDPHAPQAR